MVAPNELETLAALRRARDRIDREYAKPLDVAELARGAYMSAGHFSRQFASTFGEPPYRYLMTRRIERAMTLLRTTTMPVTDISLAVGCQSLGTFTTRFTELVGVSPRAYRESGAHPHDRMLPCIARQITRPIRNQEVSAPASA